METNVPNITGIPDNLEEDPTLENPVVVEPTEPISDISDEKDDTGRIIKPYEDWRETEELKAMNFLTQSLYQIQPLRISLGNRIYSHCANNLGINPGERKDEHKEAAKIMKQLESEYKDITTALADNILSEDLREQLKKKKVDVDSISFNTKNAKKINLAINNASLIKHFENNLIRNDAEFQMARMWSQLRMIESGIADELANIISKFDMWNSFLVGVNGIGPTLAACLISTINMKKCYTVQSLWKYCGLDVVINKNGEGEGRSKKAEHMEKRKYIDKEGNIKERMSLTYNPWIKMKLMGTISGMFMKLNKEYRSIYDDIKLRLNESERPNIMRPKISNGQPVTDKKTGEVILVPAYPKARINMMSQRYMVKMFLLDYWVHGRILLGEPLDVPYAQDKLGYQCKFRTFIIGNDKKYHLTRIDFDKNLNLEMLKKIQMGPIDMYAR